MAAEKLTLAPGEWRCCGCGAPAPDRYSGCDCATGVVFRLEGQPRSACKSTPTERAILQVERAWQTFLSAGCAALLHHEGAESHD